VPVYAGALPSVTTLDDAEELVVVADGDAKRITKANAFAGISGARVLDALRAPPPAGAWQSAPFYTSAHSTDSVATLLSNAVIAMKFVPFLVTEETTYDQIGIYCQTAATDAGAALRLGVYAGDGPSNGPFTLVVEAGTVEILTTGLKTITFGSPLTLAPGLYHLAVTCRTDGTTAGTNPLFHSILTPAEPLTATMDNNVLLRGWSETYAPASIPFPATVTPSNSATSEYLRVAMRVA